MRRLKCEKETIILTNEDDGFYDVYTFNQSFSGCGCGAFPLHN